ncbi:MAG: hypothetical protein FJ086_17220 [Deltaproteobacteria bacterium]|nr:hypothetical protein [Deltaproteobacteria bacterium]
MNARALTFVALALLLACVSREPGTGDGGSTAVPDGGAPALDGGRDGGSAPAFTAANTCAQVNAARCAALQRCGLVAEGLAEARACAAFLVETACGPSLWPARVAAGTLRLLPSVAYACTQAWAVRPCELVTETPDVCDGFLQPAAGSGGSCYGGAWSECPAGEVCRGLACPRSCRQPGNAGEDCSADADCATDGGLYCQADGVGPNGTCVPPAESGAACDAWTRCAAGHFCNDTGTCEPRRTARRLCSADGECLETLYCDLSQGETSATCVPRLPDGVPCTGSGQCRPGTACVPQSGTCAPRGPLPTGTDCGTGQLCAPGLACVGRTATSAGVCIPPLPEGTPCLHSSDCEPHLSCVTAQGPQDLRCGRRLATGAACEVDRDCRLLGACVGGMCTPLPRAGESCSGHGCLYGSCAAQADGGNTCAGLLGPNAPCTFNDECSSGWCVAGACLAACTP